MPHDLNVLIADDDERMRESIRVLLSLGNYRIETVSSGGEAMEKLSARTYGLLLLDLYLGDMVGLEVLAFVQEKELDTKVIMITGDASVDTAIEALQRGAYGYLKKPFEPEELVNTAEKALDHWQSERERERAFTALSESEERFRGLVENALSGIMIIQSGWVIYRNPRHIAMVGQIPRRIDPDRLECVHPEDRRDLARAYKDIVSGETDDEKAEFRAFPSECSGAGEMKWFQCRAGRFTLKGKPAILVNMDDITRARELERLVMIKDKMSSLGRVAAGIAHEIRNPLTGVNSYLYTLSDLLGEESLDEEEMGMARDVVGQIQTASNKIETVIKRVLDFSKPTMPRVQSANMNQLVEEALEMTVSTMRSNGIRLEKSYEGGLPDCRVDPALMGQVFVNLLNNAIRAVSELEGDRAIRAGTKLEGDEIIVTISDSGNGVPDAVAARIFDPFFSTSASGSGIGLSLVQRIVADHQGTIMVKKSDLGGAEFEMKLPVYSGGSAK